jgi:DNA-binding NarL/FixJ family response regulator
MKSTSPPSPLPESVHALVVEDDVFFQSAICEALKTCRTSITPSLASSAKQALRVLEADTRSISLVLVDLGLPDDDGVNLLKTIKSQWPALVCMVVSISGEPERVLAAMSEGACGCLVKGTLPEPNILRRPREK